MESFSHNQDTRCQSRTSEMCEFNFFILVFARKPYKIYKHSYSEIQMKRRKVVTRVKRSPDDHLVSFVYLLLCMSMHRALQR